MSENNVVAAGKSKEEIAYMLMRDLIGFASDCPEKPSREDFIRHYAAARACVYGPVSNSIKDPMRALLLSQK